METILRISLSPIVLTVLDKTFLYSFTTMSMNVRQDTLIYCQTLDEQSNLIFHHSSMPILISLQLDGHFYRHIRF